MTTVSVRFLQPYNITSYSFPGASAYAGGFNATDVAGLPSDFAAELIASGVAEVAPAPTPAPTKPVIVLLHIHYPFFVGQVPYIGGDVAGFPKALADKIMACGRAWTSSGPPDDFDFSAVDLTGVAHFHGAT